MSTDLAWKPHAGPQEFSLRQPAQVFETLYGGARGGGKTEAGIVWISEPIDHPRYNGLVLRKNSKDLSDWIRRSKWMLRSTGIDVAYNPPILRFPSGANINTGHLKDERAIDQYQGQEFHRMLLEELTQISTEDRYLQLLSSCRSTVPGISPQVFATTNPGGVGHAWVKSRFVDVGPPNTPYYDEVTGLWRIFVPSTVDDNPTLKKLDPDYIKRIEALKGVDPMLYRAWRYGDWDVFIGQMFNEWRSPKHVAYSIPSWINLNQCQRIACFDWGYTNPACMLWLAVTPPDQYGNQYVFVYREIYITEKDANWWGKTMRTFFEHDKISYCVLPHDCFSVKGDSVTIADTIQKWAPDMPIKRGSTLVANARMNRAAVTHQVLADGPSGVPFMQVLASCKNLIRTMPLLVRDDTNPEAVDKRGEDHSYDALSMGLVSLVEEGSYSTPILRDQGQRLELPRQWAAGQAGDDIKTGNFWDELRKSGYNNNDNAEF